jgi:hypothetical protein
VGGSTSYYLCSSGELHIPAAEESYPCVLNIFDRRLAEFENQPGLLRRRGISIPVPLNEPKPSVPYHSLNLGGS